MTVTTPPEVRKGARTQAAILKAAAKGFRADGYAKTTLAGVADQLGITRSAVLHHFSSKEAVLREIVTPFMVALDDVLDRAEAAGAFTPASRRRFVVELVDLIARHRDVAAILTRDVSVHPHLSADLQLRDRASRFIAITTNANDHHPLAVARSLAALGTVVRPLAADDELVDFDDPATRELLVSCVMGVLRIPLP